MKTNSTLVKKGICNLLIFLVSVQVTYSLVSHFVYGKTQPDYLELIICLLIATFASSKLEGYNK
ncbi:hypothetical protein [Flavobacterium hydatis]|jgi:hypothetical protein|uniref:Uncharacterized protein n=1 Tax=Flavobacterium hydatis TaxID=991 RepID=A0A086AF64_FLAHY|nr:hypothetical protein [Flavobacterium hydatis]KFF15328.1 hypothetical protein IW20_14380 [Flavobacterium hydatis]OXA98268.1 hypothetical protein B0A62_00245 [Flavobacterium hydatis]